MRQTKWFAGQSPTTIQRVLEIAKRSHRVCLVGTRPTLLRSIWKPYIVAAILPPCVRIAVVGRDCFFSANAEVKRNFISALITNPSNKSEVSVSMINDYGKTVTTILDGAFLLSNTGLQKKRVVSEIGSSALNVCNLR